MTDEIHLLVGAYVLGGLDPEDRHRFTEHLSTCDRCRDEVARSAAIPGLLLRAGTLSTAEATDEATDGELAGAAPVRPTTAGSLLARVRADRRRRARTRVVALAVAACLALVLVVTLAFDSPAPVPGRRLEVVAAAQDGAGGEVTLTAKPWGTSIAVDVRGLPAQGPFRLEVADADGHVEQAATWGATDAGRAVVTGATSHPTSSVTSIRIVGPDGALVASAHA